MRLASRLPSFLALLPLLAGCGGATTSTLYEPAQTDGGVPPSSEGGVPPTDVPSQHRPSAATCASHSGGGVACTSDAQCQALPPAPAGPSFCFQGHCGVDQCLSDADCANGGVCSCAGETRGYAGQSPGNVCVPADCHRDADCGPGGYCSPTISYDCGSFYGVQGYYCHRPGDACMSDRDCGSDGGGGGGGGQPFCAYDTQSGRWACGDSFCAG